MNSSFSQCYYANGVTLNSPGSEALCGAPPRERRRTWFACLFTAQSRGVSTRTGPTRPGSLLFAEAFNRKYFCVLPPLGEINRLSIVVPQRRSIIVRICLLGTATKPKPTTCRRFGSPRGSCGRVFDATVSASWFGPATRLSLAEVCGFADSATGTPRCFLTYRIGFQRNTVQKRYH